MKFSVLEILRMVEHGIIEAVEARILLKVDEELYPKIKPEEPQQMGEPGSVPAAGSESLDVNVLPLSE